MKRLLPEGRNAFISKEMEAISTATVYSCCWALGHQPRLVGGCHLRPDSQKVLPHPAGSGLLYLISAASLRHECKTGLGSS